MKEINSIRVSASRTSIFTDENIERGIQALKNLPMNEGYIAACEKAYNLLTLGQALEQSVDGDKKASLCNTLIGRISTTTYFM